MLQSLFGVLLRFELKYYPKDTWERNRKFHEVNLNSMGKLEVFYSTGYYPLLALYPPHTLQISSR